MGAAALALELDEDHFAPFLDRSISVDRANNYQRRDGAAPPADGQMRMGAHTDYGSITVLLADHVAGPAAARRRRRAGTTCCRRRTVSSSTSATSSPSGRTTAGARRCTASCRRRPTASGPLRRRSIAWFQQPNWDAVIECLPTCCDAANPARHRAVTSGDHLMAKLMGPRLLRPSEPATAADR